MTTIHIQSKSTFQSVGQGLFYSCEIKLRNKVFTIVYDCGTTSPKTNIDSCISTFPEKKIDLLVISHFDKDHISGIQDLLKKTGGANQVAIPYLHPEECLLALSTWSVDVKSTATFNSLGAPNLMGDPQKWLPGAEKIFQIRHGEDQGDPRERDISHDILRGEGLDALPSLGGNQKQDSCAVSVFDGHWALKFYQASPDNTTRSVNQTAIQNKVVTHPSWKPGVLFSSDSVSEWLSTSPNAVALLKEIYDEFHPSSTSRTSGKTRNSISLFLLHGPACVLASQKIENDCWLYYSYSSSTTYSSFHFNAVNTDIIRGIKPPPPLFTMLTGDACLKDFRKTKAGVAQKWLQAYKTHYGKRLLSRIGIVCLPHHGGAKDWNTKLLTAHRNAWAWVASFGLGNSHGHPGQSVVQDFIDAHIPLFFCHQKTSCVITFDIFYTSPCPTPPTSAASSPSAPPSTTNSFSPPPRSWPALAPLRTKPEPSKKS